MSFPISHSTREYSEMKINDLVKAICEQYVPAIEESFQSILVHLRSAHIIEPKEEEVNYLLHHIKRLSDEFEEHVKRERTELYPVHHRFYTYDHQHGKSAIDLIEKNVHEHGKIRIEMAALRKLSAEFHSEPNSPPSHKLAYAQMNVLEQDLHRLFFIEEQYLFPVFRRKFRTALSPKKN